MGTLEANIFRQLQFVKLLKTWTGFTHFQSRMGKRAVDAAVLHRPVTFIMSDNIIFSTLAKTNELKQ